MLGQILLAEILYHNFCSKMGAMHIFRYVVYEKKKLKKFLIYGFLHKLKNVLKMYNEVSLCSIV